MLLVIGIASTCKYFHIVYRLLGESWRFWYIHRIALAQLMSKHTHAMPRRQACFHKQLVFKLWLIRETRDRDRRWKKKKKKIKNRESGKKEKDTRHQCVAPDDNPHMNIVSFSLAGPALIYCRTFSSIFSINKTAPNI